LNAARSILTHRNLELWSTSIDLCIQIYRLTQTFPAEERFGLSAQLRRAAVSIPSNIAEGAARGTSRDFIRFLRIARGSLVELETQLEIARRCGFCSPVDNIDGQVQRIGQMLSGLVRTLAKRQSRP